MSVSNDAPDNELTPEAREVIQKARRSFGVSMAILMLGFITLAGVLVYRAMRDDGKPGGLAALETINLPQGAEMVSAAPEGNLLALTFKLGGETRVRVIDMTSGAVVRDIVIGTE